ncbi:MAG: SUMF1/EgtB/PvdO family nonheme iron enzyme [Deltaproteobacteria bacterium]|nr:SUMF1/EgtB/PvdO family nonheme iron enzyme [Deltaproteobacteria bacterium]
MTDLLSFSRRLLIIGDPGGGKTTFLRLIACVLAKDGRGEGEPGRQLYLGLSLTEPAPIPILIRLSALARTLKDGCAEINDAGLWRVLLRTMKEVFGDEKAAVLQNLLDDGHCALLLDGLDEEADQNIRKQMAGVVHSLLYHWGNNLIVLSSRPFGYHAVAALEDMATAYIDSFGKDEILEFLNRWASALFPDDEERSRKAYLPELIAAVLNTPRIRLMARNPVMLTCLCMVHWNERKLPEGKADLLAAVLRWLLESKEEKRHTRGYENPFAEECFKALALAMTINPQGKQATADLAWAAEQLKVPFLDELGIHGSRLRRKGLDFLEAEMIDSGIVEQAETGQLKFWHYTFQDHYAGKSLVELSDDEGEGGWWQIISKHLDDRQWDEVIDHFAGCLALTGRRRLHLLVERILGTSVNGDLSSLARAVGVLGRILRILEVYKYQPPDRLGWEKARNEVMEIFTIEGAKVVPVNERIAAAEALGQAGDPRINPLDPEMLPVPGMPDVFLGRHPVTVKEFEMFLDNKGYENPQYWGEWWPMIKEEAWMEPKDWDGQKEHTNRPVTSVSWYEAVAYCNWLSEQTGTNFRLPKSEEWEKAATNSKGEYPWGDKDPDPELLNFEMNVGRPTPVGVYPAGIGPGGHLDLSGNVWEWNWDSKEKGASRVVRGGGWFIDADDCRSAIRYGVAPDLRHGNLGFRLSRSVSLGT